MTRRQIRTVTQLDEDDCEPSAAGTALMLLCWQEPTDRALAGWCPAESWPIMRESWSDKAQLNHLARLCSAGMTESDEIAALQSGERQPNDVEDIRRGNSC